MKAPFPGNLVFGIAPLNTALYHTPIQYVFGNIGFISVALTVLIFLLIVSYFICKVNRDYSFSDKLLTIKF